MSMARYLVVRVCDSNGLSGFGEAATTPLWSGESAETARWMVEQLFAPELLGHSFDHPCEALAVMDRISIGNPFAKSAVDTAIWDLWARLQEMPVCELIGDRNPLPAVPTRASIGTYPEAETVRIAGEFWRAGIRTFKFKIGNPGFDDPARLRAVREALGDEPIFTVDANGGYKGVGEAVAALEALLTYRIALVEQPTPRERIHMLAQVRKEVEVPVMADECVFSPGQLEEALELDAFDILFVYPGKNGGFTHALEMARTVRKAGKLCSVGSNLETDLGQAAKTVLAASLSAFPVEQLSCDLSAGIFYARSSVMQPLELQDGRVKVPTGHGFGVDPVLWE